MERDAIVYGVHAVEAALRRRPDGIRELCIERGHREKPRIRPLVETAQRCGITVREVDRAALDGLAAGGRHQGVIARCRAIASGDESDLSGFMAGLAEPAFLLVLDGIQDPHNLGACLRTADAAGVHAVIAPRDRAAGLTPVVRKVAAGAAESVPFFQVTNLARALRLLQDAGVWVVGAAGDAPATLYEIDLKGPLALVLGAEGAGLRRLTRERCDVLAGIPMAGGVTSLNVSVAAGVLLFEAVRQRKRRD